MNKLDVIFDIFSRRLNSFINPKFQYVFIRAVLSLGVVLLVPKIIGILAKLELITPDFVVKIEFLESGDTILSIAGVIFILISVWLFLNERRMENEIARLADIKDEDVVVNYYVCESYERLIEVNSGDLSNFPVANAMLLRNSVMSSLNKIISYHPNGYRHANYIGECYQSVENYLSLHADASKPDRSDGNFSYFQVSRTPSKDELKNISNEDGLLKLMLEDDIDYPISIVGCYEDACSGINLQEEFVFRQLWVSFLAITNNTNKVLQLDSLEGITHEAKSFYPLNTVTGIKGNISAPSIMLSPGKSIVVPLAILIPPLYAFQRNELSQTKGADYGERVQILKNESIYLQNIEDCLVYGDKFDVRKVKFKKGNKLISCAVRDFDLTNMFTYDLHWQCGSCPHLFYRGNNLVYVRELIATCQGQVGSDQFKIPYGVTSFVIAEIEDEITCIDVLEINNVAVAHDLTLRKGAQVNFNVKPGDVVKVTGKYIPNMPSNRKLLHGVERNNLVGEFLYLNSKTAKKVA